MVRFENIKVGDKIICTKRGCGLNYSCVAIVKKVNKTSADFLHVDVMDGMFVSDTKFDYDTCYDVKKLSTKKIDMHLMVNDINTVIRYASLKPYYLTFHVEILKDIEIIKYIKKLGIKVGLAINPETRVEKLIPYLKDIDLILFMSVSPGRGGQKFKDSTVNKIKKIRSVLPSNVLISIDGGVNDITSKLCKNADILVVGSFITDSENYQLQIEKIRKTLD